MIIPFNITLAANEVREVALRGTFIELRSVPEIVALIELNDESGGVVARMEQTEATDFVRTSRAFKNVRITNGAIAQTIRFYYGEGDAGSNRFTGVVSGEVALDAATLAALESVDLNAATLNALRYPLEHTASFSDAAVAVANTAQTIFAPAANPSGVILLNAHARDRTNLDSIIKFISHAAAPATVHQGETVAQGVGDWITPAGSNEAISVDLHAPVFIPAGRGLYFISNNSSSLGSTFKSARWRAL